MLAHSLNCVRVPARVRLDESSLSFPDDTSQSFKQELSLKQEL